MKNAVRRAAAAVRRRRAPGLATWRVPGWDGSLVGRNETSDRAAFDHVFAGAYEVDLRTEPNTILDLGANVGYASVYFALRYPAARILAVEPAPSNTAVLRRNVAAFPRIDAIEAAVWPRPGVVQIDDVGKGFWGMRVREGDGGVGVRAVTVKELFEHAGTDSVDLVKMDIEGSELDVFSAPAEWLASVGLLIIELHDRFRPGCREAVESAVARHWGDYTVEQHGEAAVFAR